MGVTTSVHMHTLLKKLSIPVLHEGSGVSLILRRISTLNVCVCRTSKNVTEKVQVFDGEILRAIST